FRGTAGVGAAELPGQVAPDGSRRPRCGYELQVIASGNWRGGDARARRVARRQHRIREAGSGRNPGAAASSANDVMKMNKISVLLVDDHSLVRRGFRRMLEDAHDITVVGEAGDGDEAVQLSIALEPQVIVMDCALPGTSGLVATRRILEESPD